MLARGRGQGELAPLVSAVGGELVTFAVKEVGWWIEKRKRKSISVSLWNKHDKLPSFFFFFFFCKETKVIQMLLFGTWKFTCEVNFSFQTLGRLVS